MSSPPPCPACMVEIDSQPPRQTPGIDRGRGVPVFEREDPVAQFLDCFHVTTQDYVIQREVLLRVGSPFDQRLSDETERNSSPAWRL